MYTDCVVIGASVLGCGYALEHSGACMIIEPSMLLASEFGSTYRFESAKEPDACSSGTKELYDDMVKRNILRDGRMSSIPISALLAKRLLDKEVPVVLCACITDISPAGGGYTVTYFGTDGERKVNCKYILDTMATGTLHDKCREFDYSKHLNAVLCFEKKSELTERNIKAIESVKHENVKIVKGRFKDEYALKLRLNKDTDYAEARMAVVDCFAELKEAALDGWRIAAISSFFDYEFKNSIKAEAAKNFLWQPSAAYNNLFDAFEGGSLCNFTL